MLNVHIECDRDESWFISVSAMCFSFVPRVIKSIPSFSEVIFFSYTSRQRIEDTVRLATWRMPCASLRAIRLGFVWPMRVVGDNRS